MDFDPFIFPTLEDYSFLYPEMEQPNVNTKKRNYPEDSSQLQTRWDLNNNINHNFNNTTDFNFSNNSFSSLIQFDNQKSPTTMNNNSRFEIEFEFDESSSSPTKKLRRDTQTVATESSSLMPSPPRRLWVKDRPKDWWQRCSSPEFPEEEFRRCFRMSKSTFEFICKELESAITKKNTTLRDAIPVQQRVAVCIWRLVTGDPLRVVSKRFGLGISTCHKIVLEVCNAIKKVLMPKFISWPDQNKMNLIKQEFESIYGIPNVGGSMYTTHIPIIAPKSDVMSYFNETHTLKNQKSCYSVTLQGVVDTKGIFSDVFLGWPGSYSNEKVFEKSVMYQRATSGNLKDVWVVGNSGFPLMDGILVPYTYHNLTWTQYAFNEKVEKIQKLCKDAFAKVKGRWSCLQKRTEVKIEELPGVLGVCCVLHNICEMRNDKMDPEWNFELLDDEMMAENGVRSFDAVQARDNIAHDLLHHGRVGNIFL